MREEILEEGTVVRVNNGFVEIELEENDKCDDCSAKLFCNPSDQKSKKLIIENNSDLHTGDHVSVSIMGKNLLNASMYLYLYPLIILVSTIFIGTELFKTFDQKELYSFLLSLIMMALYYFTFSLIGNKIFKQKSNINISKLN
jgi:positive regulator of sigma E activity